MKEKIWEKEFLLGCNYWASNAGAEMWRRFDPDTIRRDLAVLKEYGLKQLRVFTNWRDFQPIIPMYGACGKLMEFRLEGERFPENPYYLDEEMMRRFSVFCDICDEYGFGIIPGLLTGWMSGRLFIPQALNGRHLYSDPIALDFEQKFIEGFVKRFRDRDTIVAWSAGNECSCLSVARDRYETEVWTAFVSNTFRAFDDRPLVSSIHAMAPDDKWRLDTQAHHNDMLVTHPYPYFGRYAQNDCFVSLRTLIYATCMHNFYRDLGEKPCCVEEIGSIGPMVCDDDTAAKYLRLNLFSTWANGATGLMWWCSSDFPDAMTAPYTWNPLEKELGLFGKDHVPHPILREMKNFSAFLAKGNATLPAPKADAVCLLTKTQDTWGVAYMASILAMQAGIYLRFAYVDKPLPKADIYLVPSLSGALMIPGERYEELKTAAREGATVYLSLDDALLGEFEAFTGVRVNDSRVMGERSSFILDGETVTFTRNKRYRLTPMAGTRVLATEEDGAAVFTCADYGKGKVYYLNFPLEKMLLGGAEVFEGNRYLIYEKMFGAVKGKKPVTCDNKKVGLIYQTLADGTPVAILLNYSDEAQATLLSVKEGYVLTALHGDGDILPPCSAAVLKIEKK